MKKIAFCVLLILISLFVFAENSNDFMKNEIQLKVGYFPYIETVVTALSTIGSEADRLLYLPSFSIEYLRYASSRIGFGGTITYGIPVYVAGIQNEAASYVSLQGTCRCIYLDKSKIKLFGEFGLGGEVLFNRKNNFIAPFVSYHLSPIGIWFGSDKIFGTTELTFGSEGSFATLGIGFRF